MGRSKGIEWSHTKVNFLHSSRQPHRRLPLSSPFPSVSPRLVDRAVDAGGHDNVTVLVVDVTEAPKIEGEDWSLPEVRSEQASAVSPLDVGGPGWRPVALGVGLLALLAAVFASIGFYARAGWYVGEHNGGVAIFKGRPSGVLWFNPTIEEMTGVSILDLPEPQRKAVVDVIVVASLSEGRNLVERLNTTDE